jgi:membrane-associated phospholipid phosphatase
LSIIPAAQRQHRATTLASGPTLYQGLRAAVGAGWRALADFWRRRWWVVALMLVVCLCWDRAVYLRLAVGADLGNKAAQEARKSALERGGLYSVLKLCGEIWAPVLVCCPLLLLDWAHFQSRGRLTFERLFRRATFVFLVPTLAGGAAEVLKVLTRRERPIVALDEHGLGGWFHFRWWWDGALDGSNLGFASSHAAMAFGLAYALCVVWPRLAGLWVVMGVMVAFTRVLAGAHFLSDVFGGLVVAYSAGVFVYEIDRHNNGGRGIEGHLKHGAVEMARVGGAGVKA